ncbi:MAG TPA: DUF1634 domain-containing protein [Candidatus Caenarcaniphilales bacterium]|nr:DUF1634 domain-containing protein [Candidatus Caenarcaniphilales bacterium]
MTEPRAGVAGTSMALSLGTLASATCFVVGFALGLLGREGQSVDPLRADLVLGSALQLYGWGWSTLGVVLLLITPAVGLVVTFLEMRQVQRRTAYLALGVLAILVVATAVALGTN